MSEGDSAPDPNCAPQRLGRPDEAGSPEAPDAAWPAEPASDESATFARCAGCAHSDQVDLSAGTLLCRKHDMRVNAEADEIPDDCAEYQAKAEG